MAKMWLFKLFSSGARASRTENQILCLHGQNFHLDIDTEGYPGALCTAGAEDAQHWYWYNRVGPTSHAPDWCKMSANGALEDHRHWDKQKEVKESSQKQIKDPYR